MNFVDIILKIDMILIRYEFIDMNFVDMIKKNDITSIGRKNITK